MQALEYRLQTLRLNRQAGRARETYSHWSLLQTAAFMTERDSIISIVTTFLSVVHADRCCF